MWKHFKRCSRKTWPQVKFPCDLEQLGCRRTVSYTHLDVYKRQSVWGQYQQSRAGSWNWDCQWVCSRQYLSLIHIWKSIPYAGAGFKIYDPQGNQVKMTFTYPTPTTIDVFYTDANGSLVTPEKLDYCKGYSIVEVQAPYGYVLDLSLIHI